VLVVSTYAEVPSAMVAHWCGEWRCDKAEDWDGVEDPFGHFGTIEPTHWMPLPQAPSDQEEVRQPDSDVASLVAENERLRAAVELSMNTLRKVIAERDALRTQLAEAQKDAQRLDWLCSNLYWDGFVWWLPEICLKESKGAAFTPAPTAEEFRKAIDAALTPKEPQ